ncbi:MAG: hypothetical protein K2Q25_09660 [Mycobacteriaceae bacterium]|nr:hypothetical protein [Mycobacteriaceae bacterium]
MPVSAAPALDMLAGLCRQTVESFGPDRQDRFVDQPLMFRPQGLAALAQRVTLDAAGVIRHVGTDVSRMEPCALEAGPKGASSNALAHAARHPACCRS